MRTFSTAAVLLLAACGSNAGAGAPDAGVEVDADLTPDADPTPFDSGTCGTQMANIGVVNLGDPPDVLVVLDRSGSMNSAPSGSPAGTPAKWPSMKSALTANVTAHQNEIKFGLLEFPTDDNCMATATPNVNIGLNTGAGFTNYFSSRTANGNTPAHIALAGALAYFNTIPVNTAGRYVVFATDGLPNCLNGDGNIGSRAETVQAVTNLFNAGIKTFVIGFGEFTGNDILNQAAVAGGVPKPGATKFYSANSQAELDTALGAIAGGLIIPSCTFTLASAPPDPNDVTVTINGTAVPRSPSHANGWDYHPNAMSITFFGAYCTEIQNGADSAVSFEYGCPGPIVP